MFKKKKTRTKKSTIRPMSVLITALILAACGYGAPAMQATAVMYGRDGNPVVLPAQVNTIVSIAPANTEILVALGFGGNIVAADHNYVSGIRPEIATLDMFGLDLEYLIMLNPDLVVASDMIRFGGGDPLGPLSDLGIAVVYIPTSDSISGVKDDIRFLARIVGDVPAGESIIAEMEVEIERIRRIVDTVAVRRTVYFEISASPVTFGSGTFLHELLEAAGGLNIFAGQEGWFSPSAETVLTLNPDVILTSTNYIADPVAEIMGRDGWAALTAVQNGNVFVIDADTSKRPSHNVVQAIRQIAESLYPEYFL